MLPTFLTMEVSKWINSDLRYQKDDRLIMRLIVAISLTIYLNVNQVSGYV